MHLYYRAFRLFYGSKLLHNIGRRSFNNYVDIMLPFLDHRPTSMWTFYTLNLDKNGRVWSTYPPHLVHVIIKCPLVILQHFLNFLFKIHLSDQRNAIQNGQFVFHLLDLAIEIKLKNEFVKTIWPVQKVSDEMP